MAKIQNYKIFKSKQLTLGSVLSEPIISVTMDDDIPLVDLTSDNSEDDEYEVLVAAHQIKQELDISSPPNLELTEPSPDSDIPSTSEQNMIINTTESSSDRTLDEATTSNETTRRISNADSANGNGPEIEFNDFNSYEEEFPNTPADTPPPILSPIKPLPVIENFVFDQRPSTSASFAGWRIPKKGQSSKVSKQNLGLPASVVELINDTPDNSPLPPGQTRTRRKSNNKSKTGFSQEQTEVLKNAFKRDNYLNAMVTIDLIEMTGLSKEIIYKWFLDHRAIMKRHEQAKEKKSCYKRSSESNLTTTAKGSGVQADPTVSLTETVNDNPKRHRHSEPGPSNREDRDVDDEVVILGMSPAEMIQRRMDRIATFSIEKVMESLKACEDRVVKLVKLFMNPKLFDMGMNQRLVKETRRLKEMSLKNSPFNNQQQHCINTWLTRLFEGLSDKQTDKIKGRLTCAKTQVVEVWIPKLVYGKLLNRNMEASVQDFTFNSSGRMASQQNTEYTVIPFLRFGFWDKN